MARRSLSTAGKEYEQGYMNNLVNELENRDGLNVKIDFHSLANFDV